MNGIIRGMSFGDYLAIEAAHFSTLKALDVSPLHYRHALHRDASEETDAMALGRIVHAMVLTGALPEDMALYEGKTRRGKEWEAFKAEHLGKTITRKSELTTAAAMHAAVMRCPEAKELLARGEGELTVQWVDHGLRCKGRLDFFNGSQIVELKTTRSIRPDAFAREVVSRHYHAQIAFYAQGFEAATGKPPPVLPALIAVENVPPYDVAVYRVGFDALEAGARKVNAWLSTLASCTVTGRWPGVAWHGAMDLKLPEWAMTGDLPDVDMGGMEDGDG